MHKVRQKTEVRLALRRSAAPVKHHKLSHAFNDMDSDDESDEYEVPLSLRSDAFDCVEQRAVAAVVARDHQRTRRRRLRAGILILVVVAVSAAIVIAANLAGGYDAPCDTADAVEQREVRGAYGAVSSTHYAATRIGARVLQEGGNAFDAAAAMQFALNVVQPESTGIGGGCLIMGWVAQSSSPSPSPFTPYAFALDGREETPRNFGRAAAAAAAAATEAAAANGGSNSQGAAAAGSSAAGVAAGVDAASTAFCRVSDCSTGAWPFRDRTTGGHPVGVPGTLAATARVLREHGTYGLAKAMAPAISLARNGYAVSAHLADRVARNKDRLALFTASQRLFPGTMECGQRVSNPELARTFEFIARSGIGAMYGPFNNKTGDIVGDGNGSEIENELGALGRDLVAAARAARNPATHSLASDLDVADLANYRAVYRPVLRVPLSVPAASSASGNGSGGKWLELLAFPPPTSGGIALAQSLALLNATANFHASTQDPLLALREARTLAQLQVAANTGASTTYANKGDEGNNHRHTTAATVEALRQLARAQDLAFADRNAYLGDADWDNTTWLLTNTAADAGVTDGVAGNEPDDGCAAAAEHWYRLGRGSASLNDVLAALPPLLQPAYVHSRAQAFMGGNGGSSADRGQSAPPFPPGEPRTGVSVVGGARSRARRSLNSGTKQGSGSRTPIERHSDATADDPAVWRYGRDAVPQDSTAPKAGTTHFSVVDRNGNVVSWTTTIEENLGSAVAVPGRGFLLNNELTDFDPLPMGVTGIGTSSVASSETSNANFTSVETATSRFRLRPNRPQGGWRPRRSALGRTDRRSLGGKRPRSTMTPTIVLEHNSAAGSPGKVWAALGSPGGSTIAGTVLNTLLGLSHLGLGAAAATEAPRLISRNTGLSLMEAALMPLAPALAAVGVRCSSDFGERPLGFVQSVVRNESADLAPDSAARGNSCPVFAAAADSTRLGTAAAAAVAAGLVCEEKGR